VVEFVHIVTIRASFIRNGGLVLAAREKGDARWENLKVLVAKTKLGNVVYLFEINLEGCHLVIFDKGSQESWVPEFFEMSDRHIVPSRIQVCLYFLMATGNTWTPDERD
jgi:hypothetical protein